MKHEITGDFPAPYFFSIDENSGKVTVKNNLKNDKAFSYKVQFYPILYFSIKHGG